MGEDIAALIAAIHPEERENAARERAHRRWAQVAKPLGSLGVLEDVIAQIAALTCDENIDLSRRTALILCADNGVVAQGVTQVDSSVTAVVAREIAAGRSPVCVMAHCARCAVTAVDMGILDFPPTENIVSRRIGNGTGDITRAAAMTRAQAEEAIAVGADLVREERERGTRLIAAGEMGIGNTTTASAVACVLLNRSPGTMTGRGAGLSDAGLRRKIHAIESAIERSRPDDTDIVDVLAKVGGFDIAGMCGIFLGGARWRVPILVDGLMSAVAALCAVRLCPDADKAIIATHLSAEPSGRAVLDALGKRPFLDAKLRLGEGTGAVAAIPLLDMAAAVYRSGASFDSYGIPPYRPEHTPC